jgi:hypothetical protein
MRSLPSTSSCCSSSSARSASPGKDTTARRWLTLAFPRARARPPPDLARLRRQRRQRRARGAARVPLTLANISRPPAALSPQITRYREVAAGAGHAPERARASRRAGCALQRPPDARQCRESQIHDQCRGVSFESTGGEGLRTQDTRSRASVRPPSALPQRGGDCFTRRSMLASSCV